MKRGILVVVICFGWVGVAGAADSSLVGWWKFDEGSGTNAVDSSGNGHDGVIKGNVTWTQGQVGVGKALSFGGNYGDYVDLGTWNPSELTGQLTLSHWLYWSGSGFTWQGTLGKRDTWNRNEMMWQIELTTTSNPPGYISFTREDNYPPLGFIMPVNQWVHVAVTFDGTNTTFYRDGQATGTAPFAFGFDSTAAMVIGAVEANGGNPWMGAIDDVRIYNRVLSAAEVAGLAVLPTEDCPSADLTGNCLVDLEDFAVMALQWLTGNGLAADMVLIPAGTFQMGNSTNAGEGNSDELPLHFVTVDSFAMGKYEITNAQYCAFLNSAYPSQLKVFNGVVYASGDTGNSFLYCDTSTSNTYSQIAFLNGSFSVRRKGRSDMSNDPMVQVSWYGAAAYCKIGRASCRERV
jgi:hypothetical protein